MARFRRIATTSLQYGSPFGEDGTALERDLVLRYIERAGVLGVDILLFQEEYTFVKYSPDANPKRRWFSPTTLDTRPGRSTKMQDAWMTLDHPYVARVREAAKKANVNVILPLMEKDGDLMYNSLVPVTASGELLRPYRKMFPVGGGSLDGECPGDKNEAQMIAGVPVSFAVCFDAHFDEVFDAARASGAKLVLWSSMWMGGIWLQAQAIRNGIYIVSSTPQGVTFVDMDGTVISESHCVWPQTVGDNVLVFEDLNFDRDIFHCELDRQLDAVREKYGSRIHMRNRSQDSIVVIETLDPDLSLDTVKKEFNLVTWYEYIQSSRNARNRALGLVKEHLSRGAAAGQC